jgi:hypothetical protein
MVWDIEGLGGKSGRNAAGGMDGYIEAFGGRVNPATGPRQIRVRVAARLCGPANCTKVRPRNDGNIPGDQAGTGAPFVRMSVGSTA